MLTDRLLQLADRFTGHVDDVEQHRAAVDLLVLTVYCNGSVNQDELDELNRFDAGHSDWDEGDFTVGQYLPVAMAKVRSGLEDPGRDALLAQFAARLTDPALRAETISECEAIAGSTGGVDDTESAFLDRVRSALA